MRPGLQGLPGIAVEVDGPFHFIQGEGGGRPDGSTLLKRRHLKLLGYATLSVHWKEWRAVKKDSRAAYLDRMLKSAVDEAVGGTRDQDSKIAGSKEVDRQRM